MHFMIQRLFGWQNGHLHHFSIAEDEFEQLTGGTIGGWERLCGSLLHYPDTESGDMYWDDDYREGQSVKSWLMKKYCGPYRQRSVSDTYYDVRREISDFRSKFKKLTDDMTLKEMEQMIMMEEPLNYLSERITLGQLLLKNLPEGKGERKKFYSDWLKRLDAKKQIADEKIESLGAKKRKELDNAADGLKIWRSNRNQIEEWKYFGDEAEIRRQTGHNSKEWLEQADNMIPYLERRCRSLFTELQP